MPQKYLVHPITSLRGKLSLPGDKSISHRAIILSSISKGDTRIENFLFSDDCICTINAFSSMGVKIKTESSFVLVNGVGLGGLNAPKRQLDMGESATSMRLLSGLLSAQDFKSVLKGGKSLSSRPMKRVIEPLRLMGAKIKSKVKKAKNKTEEFAPLEIKGRSLKPIQYKLSVPSAQVKSAILLAGLYPKGTTVVSEVIQSRDHTERMLKIFGVDIHIDTLKVNIRGGKELFSPRLIKVPSDISSAVFFMVAAAIIDGSEILLRSVGVNPTRTGILNVLKRMGADIRLFNHPCVIIGSEPIADILVKSSRLKPTTIESLEIPAIIDELPIVMVAACFAKGDTVIRGVEELRVKETDRINSMVTNLSLMGAHIKVRKVKQHGSKVKIQEQEEIVISGRGILEGAKVLSYEDHRTAMSMIIAGLAAKGKTELDDISCITKSFPDFAGALNKIKAGPNTT
ncbi:MAG: 3-phosphoshikimate 1-carboxyvinyltransferase [Candidatus Omnitrophota bacterium]